MTENAMKVYLTPKQRKNLVPWEAVERLADQLQKRVLNKGLLNKAMTWLNLREIQQYVVLKIFTEIEPLYLSLAELRFGEEKRNCVTLDDNPVIITETRNGAVIKREIPDSLARILKEYKQYLAKNDLTPFLFYNKNCEPMSRPSLSKLLSGLFRSEYGRKISMCLLRIIWNTHIITKQASKFEL